MNPCLSTVKWTDIVQEEENPRMTWARPSLVSELVSRQSFLHESASLEVENGQVSSFLTGGGASLCSCFPGCQCWPAPHACISHLRFRSLLNWLLAQPM